MLISYQNILFSHFHSCSFLIELKKYLFDLAMIWGYSYLGQDVKEFKINKTYQDLLLLSIEYTQKK